jgi:hypothetical protein
LSREIFVFGSNLSGIHGAGAARCAYEQHGAQWGVGVGLTGDSYAIPTKSWDVATSLPIADVFTHVGNFLRFARRNRRWQFKLTAIGCGLAGFRVVDIAPLFRDATPNVKLPPEFRDVLSSLPDDRFWSYEKTIGLEEMKQKMIKEWAEPIDAELERRGWDTKAGKPR